MNTIFIKSYIFKSKIKLNIWNKGSLIFTRFDFNDVVFCIYNKNDINFCDIEEFHFNKNALHFLIKINQLIEYAEKEARENQEKILKEKIKKIYTV